MSLSDLTRSAILSAIEEHDRIGREEFLRRYGFGTARDYRLLFEGREYDSKAIAGVAHQYTATGAVPMTATEFSGGRNTVKRTLEALGFVVSEPGQVAVPSLTIGRVYAWEELGTAFGFDPQLFQVGGGMLSRPAQNVLLLITHPGGARSFDYEDRWDGNALIYTGRGKTGDQRLEGPNRDVAENRKQLFVFEAAGSRQLQYRGRAVCTGHWLARAPDSRGAERNVLKFRLMFESAEATASADLLPNTDRRQPLVRTPRPFSADPAPSASTREINRRTTPEETAALQEKANHQHHRILVSLHAALTAMTWQEIEEIPGAIDLWARTPDRSARVIFEVKGLTDSSELAQCRAALAQLFEYRFFYGTDADRLCVVVDAAITDRRRALLESVGVAVLFVSNTGQLQPIGQLAVDLLQPRDTDAAV
jgi:hypothetical protein